MSLGEKLHRTLPLVAVAALVAAPLRAQVTQRASVRSDGGRGNGNSAEASISADGRCIAFYSGATNLVPGDVNLRSDVFLRDRIAGTTELVSVSTGGVPANHWSFDLSLSADGQFVAFRSLASNLVPGDANSRDDIFLRDRLAGTTVLVSVAFGGGSGDDDSIAPSVSSNGKYVAFQSDATDLVPGDTNLVADVFLRDLQSGTTELVSLADDESPSAFGGMAPSISDDGRFVAFESYSTNLVSGGPSGGLHIYVRDRQLGTTGWVDVPEGGVTGFGPSGAPSISGDGRFVAFRAFNSVAGDPNGRRQIFVRDRQLGTTVHASVSTGGIIANDDSFEAAISADGRCVAFRSNGTNLVAGDANGQPDVFVRDLQTSTTERVDVSSAGEEADVAAFRPSISSDGRFVAFESTATNLVPSDTSSVNEVYVRDRTGGPSFTSACEPGVAGVIGCPCGNPPAGSGRGCDNSASTGGAILSAAGGTYLSSDSLVFTTSGEKPTATSVLLQGTTLVASGVVYGQGVRCVGGTLKRLYTKTASGGSITAPNFTAGDPSVSARSAAKGSPISAGQTRTYLVFYRDPVVLGGCPSTSTFNATQTGIVIWSP